MRGTVLYAQALVMTLVLMPPSALDTYVLSNLLARAARLFLQPGAFMLEGVHSLTLWSVDSTTWGG
jgi:hypothetical protein